MIVTLTAKDITSLVLGELVFIDSALKEGKTIISNRSFPTLDYVKFTSVFLLRDLQKVTDALVLLDRARLLFSDQHRVLNLRSLFSVMASSRPRGIDFVIGDTSLFRMGVLLQRMEDYRAKSNYSEEDSEVSVWISHRSAIRSIHFVTVPKVILDLRAPTDILGDIPEFYAD